MGFVDANASRDVPLRIEVKLQNSRPGAISVAEIALALDVLTGVLTDDPSLGVLEHAHDGAITALAGLESEYGRLIVSGGTDSRLRTWMPDGSLGPLQVDRAHQGPIYALSVHRRGRSATVITGGADGSLRSWRANGAPGPLSLTRVHSSAITAITVLSHNRAPIVVSASDDGTVHSFSLDGSLGPLQVDAAHAVRALGVIPQGPWTQVVAGGDDGALRAWMPDGSPGPLQIDRAHEAPITALAVLAQREWPLVVTAGGDGTIRSWWPSGAPGPLQIEHAHGGVIAALATLGYQSRRLIVSGGADGRIRTWEADGAPGPVQVESTHVDGVRALAVLEDQEPIFASGTESGTLSVRPVVDRLPSLRTPRAREIEVRDISFGSLELVLVIPVALAGTASIARNVERLLNSLENIFGFPAGLSDRLAARRLKDAAERANAEADLIEAEERRDGARAAYERRRPQEAGWEPSRLQVDIAEDGEPAANP